MNNTSFLPAVVTIVDLTPATTLLSNALFEAVQTTGGQVESISTPASQIISAVLGPLPLVVPNGGTGTSALATNQVLLGNGTSPVGLSGVATTGFAFIGNGTTLPPSFQQLGTAQFSGVVWPIVSGGTGGTTQLSAQLGLGIREVLTTARTYFVPTDYTTLQSAMDHVINGLDRAAFTVTVQIATGTYTGGAIVAGPGVGVGPIIIQGDVVNTTPTVVFNVGPDVIKASDGVEISVSGLQVNSQTGYGFYPTKGATINASKIAFVASTTGGFVQAEDGGRFIYTGSMSIGAGTALIGFHNRNAGYMEFNSGTGTVSATAAWSTYFFGTSQNAATRFQNFTWTTPAVGQRYFIHLGAEVDGINGNPDAFFPGNVTGLFGGGAVIDDILGAATIAGGPAPSSILTLESTIGSGTSDAIIFKTAGQLERGRIQSDGKWNIGTAIGPDSLLTINANTGTTVAPTFTSSFHQIGADGSLNIMFMDTFGGQGLFLARLAGGTLAAKTAVAANSIFLNIGAIGYDGTAYASTGNAGVLLRAFNAWSTGDHSMFIDFQVTPSGTTTVLGPGRSLRVNPSGGISIGTASDGGNGSVSSLAAQFSGVSTGLVAGGTTSYGHFLSSVANLGLIAGTSAPTVNAATGTLYINNGATNATSRLYINTNGTGGWANFTASA